jgi:glycosyltransferase involved in cell wall biosynthesis
MKNPSDSDLKMCMENMIFIDLYVRFYFRGLVIKTLAENGIPVHVYGSGWNLLECKNPENIIVGGPQNSMGCLQAIADSKISLNVMPWFKDGVHDRVFNSMLNGALCLSDTSLWMKDNLVDGKEIVYYSLSEINKLPQIVNSLLSNTEKMQKIIQQGYTKANNLHTWASRAKALSEIIQK